VSAADDDPRFSHARDAVTIAVMDQTLTVSLTDGSLHLASPSGDCTLDPSLQLGDGWTAPSKAEKQPVVSSSAGRLEVDITYPVKDEREFLIRVEALRGIPAVFVTSKLRVLSGTRGQYYYWQSNISADRYSAPGAQGVEAIPFRTKEWDSIPWRNWWHFPKAEGGIAVFPTNMAGRGPGETGSVFLHALPRSTTLSPGETLNASFGLAGVKDAGAAAALFAKTPPHIILALDPFTEARQASKIDVGKAAPNWLREAEAYNLYYRSSPDWTDDVVHSKLQRFPFIIGSTPDRKALERCHKAGVKLLHYVVYTCLLDTDMQKAGGGKVYSEWYESIDNESRDLKDHPDWKCIDDKGQVERDAWGKDHGHPGLLNTCLHQKGLHEAAVRQVRMLMEMGYDGVFIDLAGPTVECYGPQFGKHTHTDGRKTNTEAYEDLLREIYQTVKSFGNDRVVIQNTCTSTLGSHWAYTDAQMLEAFPYGEGSTDLRSTWPEMRWSVARHDEALARGKVIVTLPYFGGAMSDRMKDAALLSYAYSRLYGPLWADGYTLAGIKGGEAFADAVYGIRLGRPTSDLKRIGGVQYRAFEKGVALLNPDAWAETVKVPVAGTKALRDVGWDRNLTPEGGSVCVEMPAQSGRVLVRE
jgi:hypothetical protein